MKRIIGTRMLKTGIAVAVALIISKAIGIESTFAGVVALIGLKQTTKKTIHYGTTLLFGSILSILIGIVVGNYLGVGPFSFGVGTILAISLLVTLKLTDGLILSIVVMYHVLEAIPISLPRFISFSLHEILIVTIGIFASIAVNIAAPQKFDQQLLKSIKNINHSLEDYLYNLSNQIRNPKRSNFDTKSYYKIDNEIKALISKAKLSQENCLSYEQLKLHEQFIFNLQILDQATSILDKMTKEIKLLNNTNINTKRIAKAVDLLAKIQTKPEKATLSTYKRMYKMLENLEHSFEASPLPQSREEFIDRSALYHVFIYSKDYLDTLHKLKKKDYKKITTNKALRPKILTPYIGIKK